MSQYMDADDLHRRLKKCWAGAGNRPMIEEDISCGDALAQINAAKPGLPKAGRVALHGALVHNAGFCSCNCQFRGPAEMEKTESVERGRASPPCPQCLPA